MPKKMILALVALVSFPTLASEVIPGPIPTTVIKVTDGDTATVEAHIWLGQRVETAVRLGLLNKGAKR